MQKTPRLAGLLIKLLIKINNLGLGGGRGGVQEDTETVDGPAKIDARDSRSDNSHREYEKEITLAE